MHRNNYFITAFLYFVMLKFYFQMVMDKFSKWNKIN